MSDKAPDKITINVKGQDTEVFMSFALLNRLASVVNASGTDVSQIMINSYLQDVVIKTIFLKTEFKDQPFEKIDIEDLKINIEDGDKLLSWTQMHVLDFLMRGLEKTAALAEKSKAVMEKVQKSLTQVSSLMPSSAGTGP